MKIKTSRFAFFLIFSLGLGLLFLAKPTSSLAYTPNQDIVSFEKNVYDTKEFNNESHSYATTENIIQSLNNMILGCATEACTNALASKGLPANGAVGAASGLIASLYATPPASSAYYLADLGQRLNLTRPTYAQAQGIGFSGLTPLLPIWKAARNVAYTFFIFLFLIIGFAIMFRAKINPQTVVTIQSAIPKAVVALILVTFSYAIAGLMIDLMYLVTGIGIALLQNIPGANIGDASQYYGGGFMDLLGRVFSSGWESLKDIVSGFAPWVGGATTASALGVALGLGILIKPWTAVGGFLVPVFFLLIWAIVMLYLIVKIFLALLMAYVQIVISILIAPFQLMISAIPGQNTTGSWLKNLTANLLVFPATALMLALSKHISGITDSLWTPPLLGAFGESTGQAIGAILGFGILLLTPKVNDIIKSMFEKKPFEYGTAIGQGLAAPGVFAKRAGATVVNTAETVAKATGQEGWIQRGKNWVGRRRGSGGGTSPGGVRGSSKTGGRSDVPLAEPLNLDNIPSTPTDDGGNTTEDDTAEEENT